jgi:peptidyl-prolyl cis-trans isomerase C
MELREPPRSVPAVGSGRTLLWPILINSTLILALIGIVLWRPGQSAGGQSRADLSREVASKLKAAGALDEAAPLYEDYLRQLAASDESSEGRARIAYSLGQTYLDRGQYEKALRWFYEAETLGAGSLNEEVNRKIVHSLERLGRFHVAQAALDSRVRLGGEEEGRGAGEADADDPVVARIGSEEIRRSAVERALDELPPEVSRGMSDQAQREQFLRRFVADELMWRKAQKLEYDDDPLVRRQMELLLKQLSVSRFVEAEVVGKVEVDETDLETYFTANQERYRQPESVKLRLLRVASRQEAEDLATQLDSGASFADLAAARSLHAPSRDNGGLIDRWIPRGAAFLRALGISGSEAEARQVSEAVFARGRGEVTPPLASGSSFFLFRVEDKRAAETRSFEELRSAVERDYRLTKIQSAYESLIESELATAEVELFPERLGEER